MADIIAKIGKYFAEQESQMREMYAQAAAEAASASVPAKSAAKAPVQPPKGDFPVGRHPSVDDEVVERPPSLLRRRLMTTTTGNNANMGGKPQRLSGLAPEKAKCVTGGGEERQTDAAWTSRSDGEASSDTGSRSVMSMSDAAPSSSASSSSRKMKVLKKKKKLKKKKSEKSDKDEHTQKRQQLEMKAEEGLARAQERARRIQMEKLQQQKQQQQERDANAARLQEEMRKIEEIRQKGKQFALRLRPQSAPSTPQSSQATLASSRRKDAPEESGDKPEKDTKRTFLNELERQMHNQMMLELVVNERANRKYSQEQQEWAMLQSQIKKTSDRNDIRAERVRSLTEKKKQLENQIEHAQIDAMSCRQERHQLEEKSKRERVQRQREAEREIHARLRKEESQRLVEEERKQSDDAAEARAKARLRVQSRASLLKRVLHGCDIRPETAKSQNQEEAVEGEKGSNDLCGRRAVSKQDHTGPEIAEFEEDGLFEEFVTPQPTSPTKRVISSHTTAEGVSMPSSFQWLVPQLPMTQIHNIVREELLVGDMED